VSLLFLKGTEAEEMKSKVAEKVTKTDICKMCGLHVTDNINCEISFNAGRKFERKAFIEAVEKANNRIHSGKGIVLTQEDCDKIKELGK
jgi:recombinational DNA repair protein RecR